MKKSLATCLGLALVLCSEPTHGGLFSPKGDSPEAKRKVVLKQREEMLAELYKTKPELKEHIQKAAGYGTFKMTDLNLFLLASGRGYGAVRDNRTGKDTFMCVAALGAGLGLGLQDLRVVFIFNEAKIMQQFVDQGWQFGGGGDVAAKYKSNGAAAGSGADVNVDFKDGTVASGANAQARGGTKDDNASAATATTGGMEIYQFTQSGIALQATVQGTKYWKDSKLNQ